jgi:hypothetical protein
MKVKNVEMIGDCALLTYIIKWYFCRR